jgi:hypothetical protein
MGLNLIIFVAPPPGGDLTNMAVPELAPGGGDPELKSAVR